MRTPTNQIGEARQAGPFRIRRIDYAPGLRQPMHFHEHSGLTILLAGRIRESGRSGEAVGSALSVVVKPAGARHADEVGPRGARTLQVTFDPTSVRGITDDATALDRWYWLHGGPAAGPLVGLARLLGRSRSSRSSARGLPEERGPDERALEERVLEAVAALVPMDPDGRQAPVPDWLVRVKEALDDELEDGVDVRDLARRVGAHPVSVSRAFRRHFGETITDYRRRERVRRAAGRIAGSSATLSRVAHGGGYADHAHLCREFRRATGVTPSEFRRLTG